MSNDNEVKGVYVIIDTHIQDRYNHLELTEFAVEGGASMVQFRDKQMGTAKKLTVLENMVSICKDGNCLCIINNRVDLLLASDADGVHLGQDDFPIDRIREIVGEDIIIGGTASTLEEAQKVEESGADYVGFGHIFETSTKKKNYPPRGVDMLKNVVENLSIPVIAIGGIDASNVDDILETGAAGFAVSSAVCAAEDPAQAVQELADIYNSFSP